MQGGPILQRETQFRISGEDITQQIRGDSKNTGDAFVFFFRITKSQLQKRKGKINEESRIGLQHSVAKLVSARIEKLTTDIVPVFVRVGKIGCIQHTTSKSV